MFIDFGVINQFTFTPEYLAMLSWGLANGANPPPLLSDKLRENGAIALAKANGTLALIDQAAFLNTFGDENWSLINIKSPGTRNLTKVVNGGSLTFTAGIGWTDSAKLGYLRTHFIPSTDALNFTTNSAGIVSFGPVNKAANSTTNLYGSGGAGVVNGLAITTRGIGDKAIIRFNEATAINGVNGSNVKTDGVLQLIRTGASVVKAFIDDTKIIDDVTTSTGVSALEIVLLGYNNNGSIATFTDETIGFWMIGGAFDKDKVISILKVLFTQRIPTLDFPVWTSITNDYTTYISQLATFPNIFPSPLTPTIASKVAHKLLTPLVTGATNMYQGGINVSETGYIYYMPCDNTTIVKFNTSTETYIQIGSVGATTNKWSGGCRSSITKKIYGCAYSAKVFLEVDPLNGDTIKYFDTTGYVASESVGNLTGNLKWNNIAEGFDGRLYATPFGTDATTVAIINISGNTPTITFIDTTGIKGSNSGNLTGSAKWDSATVRGRYIYGSPSTIANILKVDTLNGTCTTFGSLTVSTNRYGFGSVAYNGNIYVWPYSGPNIMKISTGDTITFIGSFSETIASGGIMTLPDGKIMSIPLGGINTYILNPATDVITTITGLQSATIESVGLIVANNGYGYSVPYQGGQIMKCGYEYKLANYSIDYLNNRHVSRGY